MRLAQQAQHLQHYLSASIPLKGSDVDVGEDQLLPVNMEDFGFEDVQEVMNFCSSVSQNRYTKLHYITIFLRFIHYSFP